ncbi:MAG: hybrid sensor histidine kinase/response regulator [Planctomycetota bacterium]|jgi:signal transduction histidine kinase
MVQLRARILAVDDEPVDIAIIERMLSKDDYDLRTASTGEQGLEIAADFRPDIILLDVRMPGISGYEVCHLIRADSKLRYAKIIMVSNMAMVSERLAGYEAGADDYITKPFDEAELLAKIRVYLRLKSVEEVDRFKTNVLTLLSQEARSPLNNLIEPAEMLMSEGDLDAEEQKTLIERAHRTARDLQRFFENAMILNSLKSGKRQFNPAPTNLCALIRRAICEVAPRAVERNVRIEEKFKINPTICLDEQEIRRVVTAMLDNAIRFSPSDGRVTVCVSSDNEDVCLSVTDQGEGIDPDYLPCVFEELSDGDIEHNLQGQGLSLAIARQVVLGHNGTVSAESTKGSGATFTVRLPATTLPLEVAHCEE